MEDEDLGARPKQAIRSDYLRKNQSTIFKITVITILITIPVIRGKLNEKPGRSTRISPGRLPNGSPDFPASHIRMPMAAINNPKKMSHFPNEENSMANCPNFFY
jgi:hypothetical protein